MTSLDAGIEKKALQQQWSSEIASATSASKKSLKEVTNGIVPIAKSSSRQRRSFRYTRRQKY